MFVSELKEVSERTQAQYSAEIGRCKEMALRLKNMEEELNDLKTNQDGKKQVSAHPNDVLCCWW